MVTKGMFMAAIITSKLTQINSNRDCVLKRVVRDVSVIAADTMTSRIFKHNMVAMGNTHCPWLLADMQDYNLVRWQIQISFLLPSNTFDQSSQRIKAQQ